MTSCPNELYALGTIKINLVLIWFWKIFLLDHIIIIIIIIISAWFEAVQAMEVLGFLCLLAALVVVILKLFVIKDKAILKWVIVGCLAAAGNN
jgi:hypothetical protein